MHKTILGCHHRLLCTYLSSRLQHHSSGDSPADMWHIMLATCLRGWHVRSSRAFCRCAGSASKAKSLSSPSVHCGVSKSRLDLNGRLIHYLVDRLLLCCSCYTAWFCLPQYMSRPLAPGYSTRNVLGILLHCNINRGAYRWGLAYKIRLPKRKSVHQLSRCANLERSVPFARVGSSCPALDYDNSETEQRHFHISHLPKAENGSQSFKAPPGRYALLAT
jgi:hypothetical protein